MKLFTKYTRINLLSTVIIFLLGSIAFTLLLRHMLINQVDEDLRIEQNEITTYVNQFDKLPQVIKVRDQYIEYKSVSKPLEQAERKFSTVKHKKYGNEILRQISFSIHANGKWYLVTVSKSLEGTDDLIRSILIITFSVILLILLVNFIINRFILRKLWQPFYRTLETIKNFKLSNKQKLEFITTNTDEFSLMNNTLSNAINKAQQDYFLLKEFTENASHELQTPLAVIRSKLDILIQDEALNETQSHSIYAAYNALQKLSRMNQSLLLLTKIENRQFEESKTISLKEIIHEKVAEFNELWQNQNISVSVELKDASITINPQLLDVLLNNLLSNATRHNIKNGNIGINLQPHQLTINNTGASQSLDHKRLFSRFYKAAPNNDHAGLGLSIVNQICEASGCHISYHFNSPDLHTFNLRW